MSAYTHHGDCSIKDPCLRCKEFGETEERERIITIINEISFLEDYPPFNNTIIKEELLEKINDTA